MEMDAAREVARPGAAWEGWAACDAISLPVMAGCGIFGELADMKEFNAPIAHWQGILVFPVAPTLAGESPLQSVPDGVRPERLTLTPGHIMNDAHDYQWLIDPSAPADQLPSARAILGVIERAYTAHLRRLRPI